MLDWELDADAGVGRDQRGREVDLRRSSASSGCRRTSRACTRRRRRVRGAGTSTARSSSTGTTLFLPIPVDGALFSAGDGHARAGRRRGVAARDRGAGRARAADAVRPRRPRRSRTPIAWTPEAWLTFGFDEDLDEAAAHAIDGMLELMGREHGLARREALALASVVVDLRVTQMVNGVTRRPRAPRARRAPLDDNSLDVDLPSSRSSSSRSSRSRAALSPSPGCADCSASRRVALFGRRPRRLDRVVRRHLVTEFHGANDFATCGDELRRRPTISSAVALHRARRSCIALAALAHARRTRPRWRLSGARSHTRITG